MCTLYIVREVERERARELLIRIIHSIFIINRHNHIMCVGAGVGGVRGGHGEGLSVGLKEILANCPATQEGKAGLGSGCAQSGRRTADPD